LDENSHKSDALLTAEEVAARLRVRKNTIYIWVARREIPFVKLPGDTTRFPRILIEAWLMKRSSRGKTLPRGIYLEDNGLQKSE
jgi:excisionase family DNA binding protein